MKSFLMATITPESEFGKYMDFLSLKQGDDS